MNDNPTKTDKPDDSVLYLFAMIGSFVCGAGLVLILCLGARVEALKAELRDSERGPRVVVVERTVDRD